MGEKGISAVCVVTRKISRKRKRRAGRVNHMRAVIDRGLSRYATDQIRMRTRDISLRNSSNAEA